MFKLINSIVQNIARIIALIVGLVFALVSWAIFKLNEGAMMLFALVAWLLGNLARLINILFTALVWVPSQIAIHGLMFAFDITKDQRQEQMDLVQKQIDEKIYLKSFKDKRAATEVVAERLPPVTDFQRGQEDMRERIVAGIGMWFERDRKLPAHGGTAQTIQNLILNISTEPVEEEKTENDPS